MATSDIKHSDQTMSGAEKAAVILLSLGEERAAKLFSLMDDYEIREISEKMATLGTVSAKAVESLYNEFSQDFSATGAGALVGSFENTERLLLKFMEKNRVAAILEEIRGPAGRTMWDKLGNVSEDVLANYLKNEYPQTVAVVLSKIKADHAARVLALLPEPFALEVVTRMLRIEVVQREVLEDVEKTLRTEFMSNLARTSKYDPHELMAEIFNNFDRATEGRFMSALEVKSPASAEHIKTLMFTFDDLVKLDGASIQTLMRNVDKTKLSLALKGASEAIKGLFFSNMSERAGKLLKEDMAALGMVRLRDVDEAQGIIVSQTKDLAATGEIVISDNRDGEELIG